MSQLFWRGKTLDRGVLLRDALQVLLPGHLCTFRELFSGFHPIRGLYQSRVDAVNADVIPDNFIRQIL